METGITSAEIGLLFNGIPLLDQKKSLKEYGVKDGDMVMMEQIRRRPQAQPPAAAAGVGGMNWDFSRIQVPGAGGAGPSRPTTSQASRAGEEDPAYIRDMLRANPDQMALLKQNNPALSEALNSGSLEEFSKVLKEQQQARKEREAQRIRMMNADPFDLEAQRLIAKEIEQKNIDHNMELAMETRFLSFDDFLQFHLSCFQS